MDGVSRPCVLAGEVGQHGGQRDTGEAGQHRTPPHLHQPVETVRGEQRRTTRTVWGHSASCCCRPDQASWAGQPWRWFLQGAGSAAASLSAARGRVGEKVVLQSGQRRVLAWQPEQVKWPLPVLQVTTVLYCRDSYRTARSGAGRRAGSTPAPTTPQYTRYSIVTYWALQYTAGALHQSQRRLQLLPALIRHLLLQLLCLYLHLLLLLLLAVRGGRGGGTQQPGQTKLQLVWWPGVGLYKAVRVRPSQTARG